MADVGGMTIIGLDALQASAARSDEAYGRAFHAVCQSTASRVQQRAVERVQKDTGRTAGAIVIIDEPHNQQVVVQSKAPSGKPANLVLWLEHGTHGHDGSHYMRDAAAAEEASHQSAIAQANERVSRELFG